MKEFWMTLVGVSLFSGALGILSPKGHKKYLRLLTGLCLLCVMARPMTTLAEEGLALWEDLSLSEDSLLSDYDEIYNNALQAADAAYLAQYLKAHLCQRISLEDDDISVSVSFGEESGENVLKRTTVILHAGAVTSDPHAIVEEVESLTRAPCVIVYE